MAKLLVVDDEKNLRLVVQKEMARQGHDVECAEDGETAWTMLEEQDFDVVLCDINMPRLDGMGLLRRTRERSQNPPEVIMLTGQATVESAIEAMKLGAYDYLTKPYRIGELSALVTAAAEKQQLKIDNQRLRAQIARAARLPSGYWNWNPAAKDEGGFKARPSSGSVRYVGDDNGRIGSRKRVDSTGDPSSKQTERQTLY